MYIFFDTETTGLPRSWSAPPSEVDNWPRLVQLAWETFDKRGHRTGSASFVVRPSGFVIPRDAQSIHGISTAAAKRVGVPLVEALGEFLGPLSEASVVVAHNLRFDENVLRAELYRAGLSRRDCFRDKARVCTMLGATKYCQLPGPGGYKWPTLPELHRRLFGRGVREKHEAAADVSVCSKCFFELLRRGALRVPRGGVGTPSK
jgi:DNA polymerase III epsilon subunit-like protein